MWTRWINSMGVSLAVASMASRSFRSESKSVDSSDDADGMLLSTAFRFVEGRAAGGFEVASFEALVGMDMNAAPRSLLLSWQNLT